MRSPRYVLAGVDRDRSISPHRPMHRRFWTSALSLYYGALLAAHSLPALASFYFLLPSQGGSESCGMATNTEVNTPVATDEQAALMSRRSFLTRLSVGLGGLGAALVGL